MEFKEKLRQLRTENGLTQEALADAVHISRSAIAKYENGGGKPSEDTLKLLAIYFGVETDELRDDEDRKQRKNKKKTLWVLGITLSVLVLAGTATGVGLGIYNALNPKPYRPNCSEIIKVGIGCHLTDFDTHASIYPSVEEGSTTRVFTVSAGKKYAFYAYPRYKNDCAVSFLREDCVTFSGYESFARIAYAPVEYYKNEKADDAVYSLTFNAKGTFDLFYQYEQFQNQQRFIVE